jgi:very-short-patch-repair endonuclease
LEQAVAQSLARRLTTRRRLEQALARANARRGAARLRACLAQDAALTRSAAEERLLALIRRGKLPAPLTNVRIAGFEVDFLWREARVVVEMDGYAFHADAIAFEKDRERDQTLASQGMRVMRVTWKQLVQEPEAVLVRLSQALVRA